MNVLLTCAGRRNYLVRFFQEALGPRGKVIACDCSADAPALAEADEKYVVPPMDHPAYFDMLLELCRERRIRLIISVNDLELDGLARHAPRFRAIGALPIVASPETVAMCHDKWAAFQWMKAHAIPTPQTYLSGAEAIAALQRDSMRFPVLLKPRWGTSSIGILVAHDVRKLSLARAWSKAQMQESFSTRLSRADPDDCFVIQESICGQEYGIDVVNDLRGRYVSTLARRKLAMRAGNTDRAVTVVEPRLEQLGRTLGEKLGHIGSVDCDVMATDEGCFVLDINPRLGGGYPFSHLAGANLPAALIAWANGEEPNPAWLRTPPGVLASKYDGLLVVNGSEVLPHVPIIVSQTQEAAVPAPSIVAVPRPTQERVTSVS